jgi:hypothetical protein
VAEPELTLIMFKRRNGQYRLAACRGENKGCERMRREKAPKKPCADCIPCEDMNETVEHVLERIKRGDA